MKKLLPILCAVAMTQTAAISSVAPNPRNLTVQEDPGTGLYGYLNEYGVWELPHIFKIHMP